MSDFDVRWKRLARAAARAGAAPLPPAPDGASLLRHAKGGTGAGAPGPRPLAVAFAVGLLWAVAVPAVGPAWRTGRESLARLEARAGGRGTRGSAVAAPAVPSSLPSNALAKPQLPRLPHLSRRLPWDTPPDPARPKETPS